MGGSTVPLKAGIYSTSSIVDTSEEEWERVIRTNLTGVWLCMKYEIPQMLTQGRGAIVNSSSMVGLVAGSGAAYTASKHGVAGLTKAAAVVWLCSDAASFVTGHMLSVDGGYVAQ